MKKLIQGLIVDIQQMKELIKDIEKSDKEMCEELGVDTIPSKKFLISIVNTKGLSDTWEIE